MGVNLVINSFDDEYIKIDLYDFNNKFIAKIDKNQFLDIRIQAYLNDIEGLYVIYPNNKKGLTDHKSGDVSYSPENLWKTTVNLARKLMNLKQNDVKNSNK